MIEKITKLPNQVKFDLSAGDNGEGEVLLQRREIGMIHSVSDQEGAKFDISIKDRAGNVVWQKKDASNPTNRWGERINLQLSDNYYIIRVENVKGAKNLDIFVE
jgi:hypothetical protein